MSNEFVARNGLISRDSAIVSGSLIITGSTSITGSANISGSSDVLNALATAGGTAPVFNVFGTSGQLFTVTDGLEGSLFSVNTISGLPIMEAFSTGRINLGSYSAPALIITGSKVSKIDYSGSLLLTGSILGTNTSYISIGTTSSVARINAYGTTNVVSIYGSTSEGVMFDVNGPSGQLFSVVDGLSGSLFSVNTISGLPIMEAFSNATIRMGNYGNPGLIVTGSSVIATGSFTGTFTGTSTTSSFATTASAVLPLVQPVLITGSLEVTGSFALSDLNTSSLNTNILTYNPTDGSVSAKSLGGIPNYEASIYYNLENKNPNTQIISLASGSNLPHGTIIVNDTLYVSTRTNPGNLIKLNSENLLLTSSITFPADTFHNRAECISYSNTKDKLYIVFQNNSNYRVVVTEIDPVTLAYSDVIVDTGSVTIPAVRGYVSHVAVGNTLYALVNGIPGVLVKYDLSTYTAVTSSILSSYTGFAHGITYDGSHLYVTSQTTTNASASSSNYILKVDPNNFYVSSSNTTIGNYGFTDDISSVGNYIFAGQEAFLQTSPFTNLGTGKIYRFSKDDLNTYDIVQLQGINGPCYSTAYDGEAVYAAFASTPFGQLAKINPETLEYSLVTLPSGSAIPNEILFDRFGRMFTTFWQSPGKVARYYKLDFNSGNYLRPVSSTQRLATTASNGALLFDYDLNKILYYDTGSWVTLLTNSGSQTITGSLNVTTSFTSSNALVTGNVTVLGTASINTLVVSQTQLSTGSNQLGDAVNDTQTLYGSVIIPTGSLTVTGSTSIISGSLTVTADSNLSSRAILIQPSSTGTSVVRHNRSNTTSIATYEFLTGGFLRWAIGLRELGDDDYHIYNQGTGTDAITIKRDNGFVGIGFLSPSASLDVSGSGRFTSGLLVTGSFTVTTGSLVEFQVTNTGTKLGNSTTDTHSITGSVAITASASTSSAALTIYKSGSTTVDIQGSQGQLFSIVDSLSGSLMSVNDVSGLPILEVFSDDRITMGTFGSPAMVITGSSAIVSGSMRGRIVTLSTASATASMDCSLSNFFNLVLSSSSTIHLSASNVQPGQTINLRVTQPATSGSLTYGLQFKFAGGIPYTASATGSAVDLVSFITFDSTNLYGSAIKNLS